MAYPLGFGSVDGNGPLDGNRPVDNNGSVCVVAFAWRLADGERKQDEYRHVLQEASFPMVGYLIVCGR